MCFTFTPVIILLGIICGWLALKRIGGSALWLNCRKEERRQGRKKKPLRKPTPQPRALSLMPGCWFVVAPYVDWWVTRRMYGDPVWFWSHLDELSMIVVPRLRTPASWPHCNNSVMDMYCVLIWPKLYIPPHSLRELMCTAVHDSSISYELTPTEQTAFK